MTTCVNGECAQSKWFKIEWGIRERAIKRGMFNKGYSNPPRDGRRETVIIELSATCANELSLYFCFTYSVCGRLFFQRAMYGNI